MSGHNVSFSQRKTKRQFRPNIQRTTVTQDGRRVRLHICTRCLKTTAKV
ncbi:50S ribosomal protein L28 (fragment) [Candidatus Promineifilum breve]|uniref:Large ribosomal subunit protein bL28 n=2 Tax=Candidatus Promineifilum breve TaxID=1806508 RepID=A0A160T5G4_9CHLR